MSGIIFPASPNWYCSKVSDCNEDEKFVFAAHNKLHVVDFSGGDLKFSGSSWEVHVERCCSLSLCQIDGFRNLCCTCGDDGLVRVWNVDTRSLMHEYDGGRDKLTTVHWSPLDSGLIIIGDEKGSILSWRPKTGGILLYTPEKGCVSALACSPHDAWHVAVGYKSGVVFVFDLHRDGAVLHRLRGHDEEVLSIMWCPVLGEADSEKSDSDEKSNDTLGCLLATGSRDRSIRVWSSSTGRVVQSFTLPTNTGHRRERFDDARNRAWVTLSWPKQMPENLLSSSHGGELLIWDIWKKSKQKWRVIDAQGEIRSHWRTIFNISVAKNYCFTISMDRQLCMWDLSDMKCVATRPTMGGFIYTMVNSPVNPGNVAIGVGDQVIRLLNVSQPANLNKVTNLWQGIKSKVTALCWHPVQENLLAYGTDDGRVGVYDAFKNKPPVMANSFHKGTVYSVTFGPPCSAPGTPVFKTSHALYSCGDGIINLHNPSRLDTKAVNTNEIIMKTNQTKHCLKRSEIRWKLDQSVAAIGNEDGSVEIVCVPDLKILCVIHSTKKLVNTIQWHPEYTTDLGQEQSKLHTWLAIGSNDSSIHVIDWVNALPDLGHLGDVGQHQTVTESARVLTGHTARVTCLSWSVHREGMLASASYDRTIQVWNVITNEPLANYRGHNGLLLSVLWHPLKDGVIFSGGDDFTVHCWKPSEVEDKVPPPKGSDPGYSDKPRKKKKKKGKGGKPPPSAVEKAPDVPALNTTSLDEVSKSELLEMIEKKRIELAKAGESSQSKNYENGDSEEVVVIERLDLSSVEVKPDAVFKKVVDSLGDGPSAAAGSAGSGDAALLAERKKKLTEVLGLEEEKSSHDSKEVLLPKRDTRNMKVKKRRLLFPLGNEMENNGKLRLVEDCLNIAYLTFGTASAELTSMVASGKLAHLGTFIDKSALYEMVTVESEHHLAHGHTESYIILEIWKGNIAEMLQVAEENNQLSDFLISMASFSKHPMFLATCEAYAKQLEKCDNFMKATCYYLVCFKVYEAIDMLVKNRLFKEAVVLARLRLPSQDPKIGELFIAWADHLINDLRTPEQAAKCYLAVGNVEEAMRILTRRNDIVGFKNASKIAFICQKDDLGEEYARKMSHLCLQNYDWKAMNELIEKQARLKDMLLLGVVHKKLSRQLKKLNLLEATLQEGEETTVLNSDKPGLPEIILNADVTDSMIPWKPVVVNRQSFLHDVIKTWYHQCDLMMEESAVKELYDTTSRFKPTVGELAHLTYRQGLVHVSSHLSLVILALLLGDKTAALNHMLDAMVICFDQKLEKLLQGLCNIMLPLGPEYISRLFQEVQAVKLAARFDGSVSTVSASTISEIGKQEVQQEAMTAYYCWSVVKYVLQNLETEECRKEAGKSDIEKQTDEAGPDVGEGNGEGDSAKTEIGPDLGTQQGSLKADIGGASDCVKSKGTLGAKILGYITPIRIESFFQVLLHKIQSRRFMCTEKLAYIESAIKLVQERTKEEEMSKDDLVLPAITLPAITPRTPIPSVCIDDGELDNVAEHESSPDHVELKIGGSEMEGVVSKSDSVQVVYKKTLDTNTLGNDVANPSPSNGLGPGGPDSSLNTSLDASSTLPVPDGLNHLFPFGTPSGPDDSIVGASPSVEVDGDYVEMDKLRAWAAARKRHSDFALMMFKDCFSYDNVPQEWYTMPASEKYTKEYITMDVLANEKDQVSKQLAEVAYFVKDVPFPNPHLSSKVLLDICVNLRNIHKKEVSSYIETITAWIKENGVTREHLNWIEADA